MKRVLERTPSAIFKPLFTKFPAGSATLVWKFQTHSDTRFGRFRLDFFISVQSPSQPFSLLQCHWSGQDRIIKELVCVISQEISRIARTIRIHIMLFYLFANYYSLLLSDIYLIDFFNKIKFYSFRIVFIPLKYYFTRDRYNGSLDKHVIKYA
jgi:hypothetical protein